LDALEHTAHIYCMVKMMGGAAPIASSEVDRLFQLARPVAPPYRCEGHTCPPPEPVANGNGTAEEAMIVEAVLRSLGAGR
jgi:hypothetical protein